MPGPAMDVRHGAPLISNGGKFSEGEPLQTFLRYGRKSAIALHLAGCRLIK